MECNQQKTAVATTVILYENFLEEKAESDLLIPDYYPAADRIIQCSAEPVITAKDVTGDHLNLEGFCKFCVIYRGEDDAGIKSLSETVSFSEAFPLKNAGEQPLAQVVTRVANTACRLLNPRKINCRATISIAIKVRDQQAVEAIEAIDCPGVESLFAAAPVYTVLDHIADTAKVQGEMEVQADIQDILCTNGRACVREIKVLPGKAVLKGTVDLHVLYTPETDPLRVENAETSVPFTQTMPLNINDEGGMLDATVSVQNIRTDVETNEEGKNRLISVTTTIFIEGELFENREYQLLVDAYSNRYPLTVERKQLNVEELIDTVVWTETIQNGISIDRENLEILHVNASPIIQKISGQEHTVILDGVLDVALFLRDGDTYRGADKVLPFTLKKELPNLSGRMRCEVAVCVLRSEHSPAHDGILLTNEIACTLTVFAKKSYDVIESVEVDTDNPLENAAAAPLVVYFAEKGERLWDIARKYGTSVSVVKEINALEQDVLDAKRLLLISRE